MKLDPEPIRQINEYAAGYDPDVFSEIIGEYIADSARLMGELESALQQQDSALLRRSAHTLKGQGATLGAQDFALVCLDLELAAKSGTLTDAPDLVDKVKHAYVDFEAALRAEIERNYNGHRSE